MNNLVGKFITLEGIDGSGKTTQLKTITKFLDKQGIKYYVTAEPGGSEIGQTLRELVFKKDIHKYTETLLFLAARKEHLEKVIKPKLQSGIWVISDRYIDSTYAYQCGGKKVEFNKIKIIENMFDINLAPDLTLFFDISIHESLLRIKGRDAPTNKFDETDYLFKQRVIESYYQLATLFKDRYIKINATRSPDGIAKEITTILSNLMLKP